MPAHRINGFTLIELMVTIAIVGIIVAIALPSFQSFMAGSRVTSSANNVVSAVAVARSEAMKRHANITIDENMTLNSNKGGIEVNAVGNPGIQQFLYNDQVLIAFQQITFQSNGLRLGAGDLVILVCDKNVAGKGRQVTVSKAGSTSVSDYTGYCS